MYVCMHICRPLVGPMLPTNSRFLLFLTGKHRKTPCGIQSSQFAAFSNSVLTEINSVTNWLLVKIKEEGGGKGRVVEASGCSSFESKFRVHVYMHEWICLGLFVLEPFFFFFLGNCNCNCRWCWSINQTSILQFSCDAARCHANCLTLLSTR